jgi:hypothetical protein
MEMVRLSSKNLVEGPEIDKLAPLAKARVPLPCIVPEVQLALPDTVPLAGPPSVPPLMISTLKVDGLAVSVSWRVPPEMVSVPASSTPRTELVDELYTTESVAFVMHARSDGPGTPPIQLAAVFQSPPAGPIQTFPAQDAAIAGRGVPITITTAMPRLRNAKARSTRNCRREAGVIKRTP